MTRLCSNCEFKSVAKECVQCRESYCSDCAVFHCKLKPFKSHVLRDAERLSFPPAKIRPLCTNCDVAAAKFRCKDCGGKKRACLFCLGCSVIHPKVKPTIGHKLEALAVAVDWRGEVEEMTVTEEEGEEGEFEGGDGGSYKWLERTVSGWLTPGILQDKRKLVLLAVTFLLSYLLIKRLLGRHVGIVVVASSMMGLRWIQVGGGSGSAGKGVLASTLRATVAQLTARTGTGAEADASEINASSLRSLSSAAAEADRLVGADDEFWHNPGRANKKGQPKMRILVKDKKATFLPNTDT